MLFNLYFQQKPSLNLLRCILQEYGLSYMLIGKSKIRLVNITRETKI